VRVGLIDYGAGNLASVRNALEQVGASPSIVRDADELDGATHLILPGVGAFGRTMKLLRERGFCDELPRRTRDAGTPLLGICVGMQVLARTGYEFEPCLGLGLIEGQVRRLEPGPHGHRLPHVGWNDVEVLRSCPLFEGLADPVFYFVHGYNLDPADPNDCVATCDYGSGVTAAVQRGRVYGVQFHPEKSQHDGLRVLRNFVQLRIERTEARRPHAQYSLS